jgi:hypothetical protein
MSRTPHERVRLTGSSPEETFRPQLVERCKVRFQPFDAVRMIEDIAGYQEVFKFETRKAEQLTCLIVGKGAGTVTLNGEGLERLTAWIGMPGNVFREFDRDPRYTILGYQTQRHSSISP